ncbi:MAG TPA: hypothetical protein VK578_05335 [Edaphobacter sp.]|nr:hypothetical protein [Edaphobacter sp.]
MIGRLVSPQGACTRLFVTASFLFTAAAPAVASKDSVPNWVRAAAAQIFLTTPPN